MIRNASHLLGKSAQSPDDSSDVFMKAREDRFVNQGLPVFGAENNVVVQAKIGGGHGG